MHTLDVMDTPILRLTRATSVPMLCGLIERRIDPEIGSFQTWGNDRLTVAPDGDILSSASTQDLWIELQRENEQRQGFTYSAR
jgi:hypothetical protein